MKEQPFSSVSLRFDRPCLEVMEVAFLENGPYSLTVEAGECLGLCGRSGVGKTQLLRVIADLIPHAGTVRLHGVRAEDVPAPQWRRMVGLVPAEPCWWQDLVGAHFNNFTDRLAYDFFIPTLARLGFGQDVLGWEVSRLSTGERQRLALVRALILEPRVLLLDEPTSGLDNVHGAQLEEIIAEIQRTRKMAVVWVSHDPEQLQRVATRVLKVEKERLLLPGDL